MSDTDHPLSADDLADVDEITRLVEQAKRGLITADELTESVGEVVDRKIGVALGALNDLRHFDGKPPITESDLTPTRDPFPWETP